VLPNYAAGITNQIHCFCSLTWYQFINVDYIYRTGTFLPLCTKYTHCLLQLLQDTSFPFVPHCTSFFLLFVQTLLQRHLESIFAKLGHYFLDNSRITYNFLCVCVCVLFYNLFILSPFLIACILILTLDWRFNEEMHVHVFISNVFIVWRFCKGLWQWLIFTHVLLLLWTVSIAWCIYDKHEFSGAEFSAVLRDCLSYWQIS
jgi:hypothetical protein